MLCSSRGRWKLCSMRRGASSSSHLLEEAPHRIRQSRSYHRREQSFTHSGVRHALLPPVADGSSAPCGAELLPLLTR